MPKPDPSMTPFTSPTRISVVFLFTLLGAAGSTPGLASSAEAVGYTEGMVPVSPPSACEDFAQRQIKLSERLLRQSKYSRALKVLNSTAENCNIEPVREKIVETLGEWYAAIRGQGSGSLQRFLNVLNRQQYLSAATRSQFERRVAERARRLIEQEYNGENFQATYRLCRTYSAYVAENFEAEYYCGTAARELNTQRAAMDSYQWLVRNWNDNQSLASWKDIASPLEELYFKNGRFEDAYRLARRRARRDPSPQVVLSSLLSVRGRFLSPLLRAGTLFYENQPSQRALSHVGNDMRRVNFPKYVKAFYILAPDGSVERGMYGQEANQPGTSLLQDATGPVSLLQAADNSTLAWLVSPLGEKFLVLEFGIATTPEENVRLETVYENVESDEQWQKLYDLEFTETTPATGSALGTILSGADLDGQSLRSYDDVFDASSLLAYYCIQDEDGGVEDSHGFDRANLAYGDSEWQRTSNTPALYHHSIEYSGQSVREVVWPKFVDETWTGVVRVGLTQN